MVPYASKIFQKGSLRHLKGRRGKPAAGGDWGAVASSLKICIRGLVSREGLPTTNVGEQILWQNHTKACREETRSSFNTAPSLWIIPFPGSPTEIEK